MLAPRLRPSGPDFRVSPRGGHQRSSGRADRRRCRAGGGRAGWPPARRRRSRRPPLVGLRRAPARAAMGPRLSESTSRVRSCQTSADPSAGRSWAYRAKRHRLCAAWQ